MDEAKTHSLQDLKKTGECIFILCVRILLVQMNDFLCLSVLWFINLDPQESEFPIMFNFFVNKFWRTEGFGCTWLIFDLGS